jgi:hypothetical protein
VQSRSTSSKLHGSAQWNICCIATRKHDPREGKSKLMEIAMTKYVLPLAVAAVAVAAPAFADPLTFKRDGLDVVGTVEMDGETRILRGTDRRSGADFDLQVKNGFVTGKIGGKRVAYPAPKARHVEVASR